jgi:hypothetical protein
MYLSAASDAQCIIMHAGQSAITGESVTAPASQGWVYPVCVVHSSEAALFRLVNGQGLRITRLDWPHPTQTWYALASDPVLLQLVRRRAGTVLTKQEQTMDHW